MRKTGSVKRGIVASDLEDERAKCAFDQEAMNVHLRGGAEQAAKWKKTIDQVVKDPELQNHFAFQDYSPDEMQKEMWRRINVMYSDPKKKEFFFERSLTEYPYTDWAALFQGLMPGIGLTVSMFRMSVEHLTTPEQKAKWLPMIENLDITGCYAQTEIGHGSNVAGIETTATLDKTTDEFVIHTPSITATKYWPGDLGRFSSHAVVFARLLIDDSDYGVQPFMVQMRDVETWKVRQGVKCGDLGPKIGYQSKDNGWASFDKVRIPRSDMLMGLCEVSKEGEMSIRGDPRVLYSVMMTIRMMIVQQMGWGITLQGTRNAIRYCCVRRQFATQQGTKEERRVIDYQTTTFALAKLLCSGLTMTVAGAWTSTQFKLMLDDVKSGKFQRMDVMHHILSGFKMLFSLQAQLDVEDARRICGGAGYQSSSGFTQIYSGVSPIPTYEGENTMMLGQSSRYLVKLLKKVAQGKKLDAPFTYLNSMRETMALKNQASTVTDFLNLDVLDKALQVRACNMITGTMEAYNASSAPSKVKDNELFYQAKNDMTRAHLKYLQFHLFRSSITHEAVRDPRNVKILELVGKVFCLNDLLTEGGAVYDTGYFAPGTRHSMQAALEQAVAELRPQMLPLAESLYMPDNLVPSTIGNYYGDIYEQQLEVAQNSRLNINNEVPEYFERLMKPVLRPKL